MSGKVYGYARVSTRYQNPDRQVIALRQFGVDRRRIVVETQSGKDFANRPLYLKLVEKLRPGDILVVQSLDRLGRNYKEILEEWRHITKDKHAHIIVLDMPLLRTQENMELIQQLLADLVLQLLSFIAQKEREEIRNRQQQGIEAAKARGVVFGRPKAEIPENFREVVDRWNRGEFPSREAARLLGVSRTTFFRWLREKGLLKKNVRAAV